MDWQERLNAALGYIEDNLDGEIRMERAADLANCSLYHFLRIFDVVAGITAADYVRQRRLSLAAQELAAREVKVIDLALRYGYDSPEAFTKAFRRFFGVSPSEARKPGVVLRSFSKLEVAVVLKGAKTMKYRIEEKGPIEVVGYGKRVSTKDGENFKAVPGFWGECREKGFLDALGMNMGPLGLLGICAENRPDQESFTYYIAVEKRGLKGKPLPEGAKSFVLPKASYGIFESVGAMPAALQDVWKRIWSEWFPTSGYEHAGTPDFEVYPPIPMDEPRGNPNGPEYYTEVWIPLKKV